MIETRKLNTAAVSDDVSPNIYYIFAELCCIQSIVAVEQISVELCDNVAVRIQKCRSVRFKQSYAIICTHSVN
jgi:hypothetical protein